MRVVIDYQKCRKTGQCSYLHPELFSADEGGTPVVRVERLGKELHAEVEDAVDCCPSGAITLLEDD